MGYDSPTYKWGGPWGYNSLILTFDPNFLGHPSSWKIHQIFHVEDTSSLDIQIPKLRFGMTGPQKHTIQTPNLGCRASCGLEFSS